MVQFGDQLEGHIHEPWRNHYITYNKLKRIIERNRFVLDSTKAKKAGATEEDVTLQKSSSCASFSCVNSEIVEDVIESTHFFEPSQSVIIEKHNSQDDDSIDMIVELTSPGESTPLRIADDFKINTHRGSLVGAFPGKSVGIGEKMNRDFIRNESDFELVDFFEVVSFDLERVNSFFCIKMKELKEISDIISKAADVAVSDVQTLNQSLNRKMEKRMKEAREQPHFVSSRIKRNKLRKSVSTL